MIKNIQFLKKTHVKQLLSKPLGDFFQTFSKHLSTGAYTLKTKF